MIRLVTDEIRIRYVYLRLNAKSYVLLRFVHPQNFFDIFQNLGADGTGLADKIRTATDSADDIRIVTNCTDRCGWALRIIRRVRKCVCDWGITVVINLDIYYCYKVKHSPFDKTLRF